MRTHIKDAKRIVIKVGTSSLTYDNGKLNLHQMSKLCEVITDLNNSGKEVILVTSGAIGAGMGRLGLSERPTTIEMKQASAAIGQAYLMQIYQKFFAEFSQICAQVLLTKDIFDSEYKKENVIRTVDQLLKLGIIPIVNENDTVSTHEIEGSKFSDNDNLSSIVAVLNEADLLIILSDIDGVYKKENGQLVCEAIEYIEEITDEIYGYVTDDKSCLGTGGMVSKLNAIKFATNHNVDAIICNSSELNVLYDCLNGKVVGTYFKGGSK